MTISLWLERSDILLPYSSGDPASMAHAPPQPWRCTPQPPLPTTVAMHAVMVAGMIRPIKKGSLGEGIYLPSATSMFLLCKRRIQEPAESSRGCPFPPRQCPLMRCFRLPVVPPPPGVRYPPDQQPAPLSAGRRASAPFVHSAVILRDCIGNAAQTPLQSMTRAGPYC